MEEKQIPKETEDSVLNSLQRAYIYKYVALGTELYIAVGENDVKEIKQRRLEK